MDYVKLDPRGVQAPPRGRSVAQLDVSCGETSDHHQEGTDRAENGDHGSITNNQQSRIVFLQ
jgi:hypothetical protein